MPKVYVANLGGHDLSDASRFGEFVYLTTQGFKPQHLDRVMFETMTHLKNFNPEKDYFLPVGQDVVNLTVMWFLSRVHKEIKVLYWDIKERRYVEQLYSDSRMEQILRNIKTREEIEKNGNQFRRVIG